MGTRITCTCGYILHREDEQELYSLVRSHAHHPQPELHRPAQSEAMTTTTEVQRLLREVWEQVIAQAKVAQ